MMREGSCACVIQAGLQFFRATMTTLTCLGHVQSTFPHGRFGLNFLPFQPSPSFSAAAATMPDVQYPYPNMRYLPLPHQIAHTGYRDVFFLCDVSEGGPRTAGTGCRRSSRSIIAVFVSGFETYLNLGIGFDHFQAVPQRRTVVDIGK